MRHGERDATNMSGRPDFVAIGHVTFDVQRLAGAERDRPEPGGAVAYSAGMAVAMGLTAGIVTSSAPGYPFETLLPSTEVVNVPADATTTFEYSLEDGVRTQWVTARAADITREDVPASWAGARIVLLGPVANELPFDAAGWFSDDSFISAVPQGWQRSRETTGKVVVSPDLPDGLSKRIDAVVVSEADVPSIRVQSWTETFPIVVVTRGRRGARMYADGRVHDVPPVAANEVDATGAGDVWAAAFAIRLVETDDVTLAANFASVAAAMSVEHRGMRGIPTRDAIAARVGTSN